MPSYTFGKTLWLVILRVMISWHFLYEGLVKILSPGWPAYPYMTDPQVTSAGLYHGLITDITLQSIHTAGLLIVGSCLLLGLFSRFASIAGICLLAICHLFNPSFIEPEYIIYTEKSYLWIDRNIIEISALMVLIYFPTSHIIGLDHFIYPLLTRKTKKSL